MRIGRRAALAILVAPAAAVVFPIAAATARPATPPPLPTSPPAVNVPVPKPAPTPPDAVVKPGTKPSPSRSIPSADQRDTTDPLPSPLGYEIHTIYEPPGGARDERSADGILLVPMPVDIGGDVTPEALVQLTIDAGRATLRVTMLPTAPATMPLKIEAILADPRGSTNLKVAFGYDALNSNAPRVFQSTVQLIGAARVTSMNLDLETDGTSPSLAVLGEVYEEGPNGERMDPQRGRIQFTPVPQVAHFGLIQGSDLGVTQSGVDVTSSIPTRVHILIEDIQGDRNDRNDVLIDRAPNAVSIILSDADSGERTWNYQASDRIQAVRISQQTITGGNITDDFAIDIKNMATRAQLMQDTPTHATFTADMPIGVLAAGSATGRMIGWLDERAYLYQTDRGEGSSFAFRIEGLSRAEFDTGDPFIVDVDLDPLPFHVLIEEGARDINAHINDLPDHVRVVFSALTGVMSYEGSAPIDQVLIQITDPAGVSGRATKLRLTLDQVPTTLTLSFGVTGDTARLDAHDASIGAVNLLLTSGPEPEIDEGFDGLVLEDVPDHYALAVRLTALKLAAVSTGDPPYSIELDKRAGPFLISLREGARATRVEVHDLPSSLDAVFDPRAGRLTYTASAPIGLITAAITDPAGVTGRATRLNLRVADLPQNLTLNFGSQNSILIDAGGSRIGSIDVFATSGPPLEVDPGYDGIVLEDVEDRYVFAVRLTGLRLARVSGATAPYSLDLRKDPGPFLVRLTQGARLTEITVNDLPAELQATIDPETSLSYTGSAPIGRIRLKLFDPEGVSGPAVLLDADIRGLPQALVLTLPSQGHISVETGNAEIGLIEMLLTSGPALAVDDGFDGAVLYEVGDQWALAVRLTGLRHAEVSTSAPYTLNLMKRAGPFLIDLTQDARRTRVEVHDLPADFDAIFDPAGSLSYTGSAAIGHVAARVTDPAGVAGRATSFRLDLDELPAALTLSYASGDSVSLDAQGATVGLVDLLATSGPDLSVPSGFEGAVLEDVEDHYAFAVLLSNLRLVSVSTSAPYELDLQKAPGPFLVDLTQGDRHTRVEVHDLPDSLQGTFDPDGSLSYTASATMASVLARVTDPSGVAGRATSLRLSLTSLPQALDLSFVADEAAVLDANGGVIGGIDLLATSGPPLAVDDGYDGLILEDLPDRYAFAARLTGLRYASVTTAAPYTLSLQKDAGPFLVRLLQGTRATNITVNDLPASITATLDPAGSFDYQASAGIGAVRADLTDPAGLGGRVTKLHVALDDLPPSLDLDFSTEDGVTIDAHGEDIGLLQVLATSGPDLAVPPGTDGVLLEDVESHYAFTARLQGLRLATATTQSPYHLVLHKAPGPFVLHLTQGSRDTLVTVVGLPDEIEATLDTAGTLTYEGSSRIETLSATVVDPEGVFDRATRLRLVLGDVPTSLTLNFASDSQVGVNANGGRLGYVDMLATSGPELSVDEGYDGVVLEDVPAHFAIAARLRGLRVATVSTGAPPYSLTLSKDPGPFLARLIQNARTTLVTIRDLPTSLTATFNPAGSLSYEATGPVNAIDASITDPAGVSGRATRATATFRSVPASLNVSWAGEDGTVSANANGATIGLLEVLLTSGPEETLPAHQDGFLLRDLTDRYVVFGRITGLKSATVAQGPPPSFSLQTTGGRPFVADLQNQGPLGVASTHGEINVLAPTTSIQFTSPTALQYRASAAVGSLQIDAFDPAGISGRAKTLHATMTSLPASGLDASWSSTGVITLDARGGTIGLVEVQLTSGPDERLASQFDGILLRDLTDRYVVFVRFTGLRLIVGQQVPQPDITLTTTGGRTLKVDLEQLVSGAQKYTRATLVSLPATVRVRVGDKEMWYDAAGATDSLVLDTNSGNRWNLHADIRGPLPAHMYFCSAGDGFCNGYSRPSGSGSFKFDASEHTTVNLFDCVRPLSPSCQRGSADEFTQADNWRIRHFEFDADTDSTGFSGYTFNNTNGHTLSGYLFREGGSNSFEADIKPGYWSNNRRVEWSWWGADKDKSGSVNCAGSSFSIKVLFFWIGITSYVC